jgi:hypothetical protein
MKPDEEPLERDSLPQPLLAPGFARRVIHQARAQQRRRQLRRRLAMVSVICGVLGFCASALIRAHLAKSNAAIELGPSVPSIDLSATRPVKVVEGAEHRGLEDPLLGRRFDGDYPSINNSRAAGAVGSRELGAAVPGAAKPSQTLVIKAPERTEEAQTSAPDAAMPEDSHEASAQASVSDHPGAGNIKQPSIQLP